ESAWTSVVTATAHRCSPILLTAADASLVMLPIAREVFWRPMAIAMIGGIGNATLQTKIYHPPLNMDSYRIKPPAAYQLRFRIPEN
ncbi:hypothetical protein RA274_28155, partial [Pseudomonas syringae pv. tagetis]|uniref:hypothetical protein n=1 Tax=Pseudomonas syringae group genomosp. 7 TaxID=251699 RepID=UPI00377076EA